MAFRASPAMVDVAQAELAGRERQLPDRVKSGEVTAEAAERSLACWRGIVAVLETGQFYVPDCLGSSPADAWPALVDAAHSAVEHRAAKDDPRATALRQVRSLLLRSAIRAGAQLPSFDNPPAKAAAA